MSNHRSTQAKKNWDSFYFPWNIFFRWPSPDWSLTAYGMNMRTWDVCSSTFIISSPFSTWNAILQFRSQSCPYLHSLFSILSKMAVGCLLSIALIRASCVLPWPSSSCQLFILLYFGWDQAQMVPATGTHFFPLVCWWLLCCDTAQLSLTSQKHLMLKNVWVKSCCCP